MDLPPFFKPICCKWAFCKKMKIDGTIDKFKAHLVAQGFRKKLGIDYFDIHALITRTTTIRFLVALVITYHLEIHQMLKQHFYRGEIDEEVYMKQPEDFVLEGQENKVCKLVKSLYRLK